MPWPDFGTWYLQFLIVAFTIVLLLITVGGAFGLTKASREKTAVNTALPDAARRVPDTPEVKAP